MATHPHCQDTHEVGTPAYRARHIAMLWSPQLWTDALMVATGAGAFGLLFYAIAKDLTL